ncbi:MAG: PDZ domain-containing protein [Verrucomicrobiota bacterium]
MKHRIHLAVVTCSLCALTSGGWAREVVAEKEEPEQKAEKALPFVTSYKLSPDLFLNGSKVVSAFSDAEEVALSSTVKFFKEGRVFILGTAISGDGYVVTKASEFEDGLPFEVETLKGERFDAELIDVDKDEDIALVKMPGGKVSPVEWTSSKETSHGTWVTSAGVRGEHLAVGIISANRREIPRRGGVLGVLLDPHDDDKELGVGISAVRPDSPADKVGLLKGDLITGIGEKKIKNRRQIGRVIERHDPGETIELTIVRGEENLTVFATLAYRSFVFDPLDRNQRMSGSTSIRKAGFSEVLQSDLPLPPEAMGTAMLDLDGKALGLNIAMSDRVTTFALPSELVERVIADLMPAKE